jgi:TPP-dependent indolepyruvate ferredoxin oxidoreductase alpha subunit
MSRGYHHKLDALRDTDPKQARSLAVSLGLQDDLTPYEELAVDHIDKNLILSPSTPTEQPMEQQLLLLMRDPALRRSAEDLTKDFENYIRSPEGIQIAKEAIKQLLYYQKTHIKPGQIEWSKVNWKGGIVLITRGFNLGERIREELNFTHGAIEIKKFRALYYHLGKKLEKIARQRFNKEFAEVLVDEIEGKSFPLALTETELKQMIMKELAERKKRKKKKKKKTKSKKRGYLYPYAYGSHYDHLDHVDYGDYGTDGTSFDGGGDGGGGE